jgi:hypothetical protein
VYVKDIDTTNSDNGDFSGTITDYFDSLKTVNSDTTANNPKTLKVWFKRTVYAHSIGLGCDDTGGGGFGTDITVKLLGSGEIVRLTKNSTGGDTNSLLIEFGPQAFNGFILEFNTTSTVCVSNITVQKSIETSASLQGQDPAGDVRDVQVTQDGYLAISDNSSGLSIAEGNVTGKTYEHKFGNAPDFDQADGVVTVWDGADDGHVNQMAYVYSSTADIDSISSDSAADTMEITVYGLDASYAEQSETVTLSGQTKVALANNYLRVFRMVNTNSSDNVGHIYCYVDTAITAGTPDDPTKVRAIIQPGNNQTLMAVYTIPAGKTGYIRDWFASTAGGNKNSNYPIEFRARPIGGVFQLKHISSLSDNGSSAIQHKYEEPEKFPEKTDLEMRCSALAAGVTEASVSAGFDVVLVDN